MKNFARRFWQWFTGRGGSYKYQPGGYLSLYDGRPVNSGTFTVTPSQRYSAEQLRAGTEGKSR